jgi:hypothetical protein
MFLFSREKWKYGNERGIYKNPKYGPGLGRKRKGKGKVEFNV